MTKNLLGLLAAAIVLASAPVAQAAPGDVDFTTNLAGVGGVSCAATLTDGKILLGGSFNSINGTARTCLARLNADGTLDATFNPTIANTTGNGQPASVFTLAVQTDGKILIGGMFNVVQGNSRFYIARLNADGSYDATFSMNAQFDGQVNSIQLQNDGHIIVAGAFNTLLVNGAYKIVRLRPDGSGVSSGWIGPDLPTQIDGNVLAVSVQSDGKIVIGGLFTQVFGNSRPGIARLLSNGQLDPIFTSPISRSVLSLAVQPDGKILLTCGTTTLGAGNPLGRIQRLLSNGANDATFSASVSDSGTSYNIRSLALQTDGKMIIGGSFTSVNGTARASLARLNANGTLDSGFAAHPGQPVSCSAIAPDGKVYVGGINYGARLQNDAATQTLSAPSVSRVQWLRGGASPEVTQVTFEVSTDGGTNYTSLGAGSAIAGGWELTALTLPSPGRLRARARTVSSGNTGSNGFTETILNYAPEIAVSGNATNIADGDTSPAAADHTDFGSVAAPGGSITRTYTISNSGTGPLTLGNVTLSGAAAADYSVTTQPPASINVGSSATFSVRFAPTATGLRSAALSFSNNDANENPFNFNIQGTGVAAADVAVFTGNNTLPANERTDNVGTHAFANTAVGSSSAAQIFTIRNAGTASLTGIAVTVAGANAGDFSVSAPGATTLAVGASTTFTVTFSPTNNGARVAVVNIASNDPDENPFRLNVGGTGLGAEITVFTGLTTQPAFERTDNVGVHTFDSIFVGSTSGQQVFNIRNDGVNNLTGLAVTVAGAHPGDFNLGALSATTVAPGATATFTVSFSPSATGERSAVVRIASNDPDENPFRINVAGTGAAPLYPEIAVFTGANTLPANERTDNVGTQSFANTAIGSSSAAQIFTILNTGTGTLGGLSIVRNGVHPGDFSTSALGATTLAPGASTTFTVTFSPTAGGTRGAVVNIVSNDADENPFRINVVGTGLAPEIAVFTGNNTLPENERVDNLGTQGFPQTAVGSSSAAQIFTIRNDGGDNLTGLAVTLAGAHPGDYSVSAPGATTLAPGASTTFTVTFAPTAGATRTAVVRIASNDPDENPFRINVAAIALSRLQSWRDLYFGTTANTGDAANLVDFDRDGHTNIMEFAFGLDPTVPNSAAQLPQVQVSGGNAFFSFATPAGVSGVTYSAEWSTTLQAGSWTAIPDTGLAPQHLFSVPTAGNPKIFLRLRVTPTDPLPARELTFSSAVASQQQGAPYVIANSITPGIEGWGMDGGQFTTQKGYFLLSEPAYGDVLQLVMAQNVTDHFIQLFEVAYTTDPVPDTSGAGGNWTTWVPTTLQSTGTTLSVTEGTKILSTGSAQITNYTLRGIFPAQGITAVRLTLYPYDFNPNDGLPASLGHAFNGNACLSDFTATADP